MEKGINVNKLLDMNSSFCLLTFFFYLLVVSCQNNSNEKDRLSELSDTTSFTGLTGESVKLVKTGYLNFKVKDIEQSSRAVSGLARKLGGMVFNQTLEYNETGRNELRISTDSLMIITVLMPQAGITLRIPSENLEDFMYSVSDLGYFTSSSKLHIDDQSLKYLENILKQKNRTEILSQLTAQRGKTLTDYQAIDVKDQGIEQQIVNRTIDVDVKYSTVNLNLFQNPKVRKEVIANYVIADYQLPFSQRIGNSIKDGWHYFLTFILALANLWVFILLGIAVYLSYRYIQQKRKLAGLNVKL